LVISNYLESLIKVLGIGAAFATIPLFAAFASLEPPWPPAIGYVSSALVLVAALMSWEWTRRSRTRYRRRWILAGVVFLLAGLFVYFYLYSSFIDDIPGTTLRVVRGYDCTADARLVYKDACPNLPADALEGAEWEATELWTRQSITNVRLALTASWLAFTAGLMLVSGGVVAGRKV
jgi:uncharacterized membrane protein YfcA